MIDLEKKLTLEEEFSPEVVEALRNAHAQLEKNILWMKLTESHVVADIESLQNLRGRAFDGNTLADITERVSKRAMEAVAHDSAYRTCLGALEKALWKSIAGDWHPAFPKK